jgi:hypothetical protein
MQMDKVYLKPTVGESVNVKENTDFSCTEADSPVDGLVYPTLSGRAEGFKTTDSLTVKKVIPFPGQSWKALVQHSDGRLLWLSDWQIAEK